VTVRTGPQTGRIQVEATKEARSVFGSQAERLLQRVDVQIEAEGSQARVDVDPLEESGIGFVNVDLLITVPEEIDLDVVNQAGHVRIEGTEGDIRVRSEAGNLRMQDVTVTQYCDVMNTTGNIVLEGRLPEPGASEDPWEVLLKSETGDIDFAVPADSRFTLDAESEVGSVSSKFQLEDPQAGSVRGDLGEWIKGNVNHSQASPSVILRTEAGNIKITPLP
jgi:DUF4097 and DUF4098 domain-containing protein YvlB